MRGHKVPLTPVEQARIREIRDLMKVIDEEQEEAQEDRDDMRVKELEDEIKELRMKRKRSMRAAANSEDRNLVYSSAVLRWTLGV